MEGTYKKLNGGEEKGKARVFDIPEESKQLSGLVKMDCSCAGKIPSSKITFRDMYTRLDDGSKQQKPL